MKRIGSSLRMMEPTERILVSPDPTQPWRALELIATGCDGVYCEDCKRATEYRARESRPAAPE